MPAARTNRRRTYEPPPRRADRRAEQIARRRAERDKRLRKRSGRPRRDRRRPRWVLPVALLAAAAVLAAGGAFALSRRDGGGAGGPLPTEQLISSYRIAYLVKDNDAPDRTERRVVQRPFRSRAVSERDGRILTGSISSDEGQFIYTAGTGPPAWQLADSARRRASDDARLLPAARWAVDHGLASVRGTDTVLGRECTIVRFSGPFGDTLKRPTGNDHADLCVDRTGLYLRERWLIKGRVVRTAEATELEIEPQIDPSEFVPEPRAPDLPPTTPGLTTSEPLSDETRSTLPAIVPVPDGFSYVGGWVRRLGDGTLVRTEQFVDGPRLVEADHGERAGQFQAAGEEVELRNGMRGWLEVGLSSSTLAIPIGVGHVLRLRSADIDVLLDVGGRVLVR